MGVYLQYEQDGTISIQPEKFKADEKLVRYISGLIRDDIRYQEARNKPVKPDRIEKAIATITRPDGSVRAVSKASAVQELSKAAETWEGRSREYGLDPDLKQHLLSKARAAKDEIARLEGREVPEPVAKRAARPVTVSIPR